jgi:hypothetical protein
MSDAWTQATGATLDRAALDLLTQVAAHGPEAAALWRQPGRALERFTVEGPPQTPRLVTYLRAKVQRPGLPLAFEWPLDQDPADLSYGVWLPT